MLRLASAQPHQKGKDIPEEDDDTNGDRVSALDMHIGCVMMQDAVNLIEQSGCRHQDEDRRDNDACRATNQLRKAKVKAISPSIGTVTTPSPAPSMEKSRRWIVV